MNQAGPETRNCQLEPTLRSYKEQSLQSLFYSKFLSCIIRKYAAAGILRIPRKELYQTLGCLFSLNKAQARKFLSYLSRELEFVKFDRNGLKIEVTLWR